MAGATEMAAQSEIAINCNHPFKPTEPSLSENLRSLLENSLAPNTLRAYRADLADFLASGCQFPSDPVSVAEYLAASSKAFAVATVRRRAATIAKLHRSLGHSDPCCSEIVRSTLRGISRRYGIEQKQAKALSNDDLEAIVHSMGDRLIDIRDRALVLLGFAGAFRRSELVAIDYEDLTDAEQGLVIRLRRSKTDQLGSGRQIPIRRGSVPSLCAVQAVKDWIKVAHLSQGPIFRVMDRHGNVKPNRLSGEAVNRIIKRRLKAAGIDPVGYSAHSLRAGHITSAIQSGRPIHTVTKISGHRSLSTVMRYVRDGSLFEDASSEWSGGASNAQ